MSSPTSGQAAPQESGANATAIAEPQAGSKTVTVQATETTDGPPTLKLRLQKDEKDKKKVKWTNETVDNEHMNKKKSKCCCVYVKPRVFGESDSEESDGECDHCSGHNTK